MSLFVLERADPRQLSVNITGASGQVYRWGPDEKDGQNIPSGLTISTQMPGGFGTMDCVLTRRPDLPYSDLARFAPCIVVGRGGLVAFDGYLSSAAMNRTTGYSFTPEAIGWSGTLKDNASFTQVYIDRQLNSWQGPSTSQQIYTVGLNYNTEFLGMDVTADSAGNPGLEFVGQGPFPSGAVDHIRTDAYYDAGANNLLNFIQWSGISLENTAINAGTWELFAGGDNLDAQNAVGIVNGYSQITLTTARQLTLNSGLSNGTSEPYRYGHLYNEYVGAAGGSSLPYGWIWENLAVIGNHGLGVQKGPSGLSPGADDGFFGGDIITHIVQTGAPLLNVTRGTTGAVVYNDNFVVPQATFNTPVDPDTAIQQINQAFLYDYGVYENRAFFWRPPGTGKSWVLRVGEGVQIQDQGPQIETAFNAVVVQYTDTAGVARYVGPPGFTGDKDPVTGATSSPLLQDTSATNPVNVYNRTRIAFVQMGTSTWGIAVAIGAIFLQTTNSRPSSGSAVATGFARDTSGRDWPVWMMRAGDTVTFADTSDKATHYILNTSYSHDTLTNSLTLDAPPDKLDWLLARLGLVISAIG